VEGFEAAHVGTAAHAAQALADVLVFCRERQLATRKVDFKLVEHLSFFMENVLCLRVRV
jgi:hypothetical protein